jgi:hypothetical protein
VILCFGSGKSKLSELVRNQNPVWGLSDLTLISADFDPEIRTEISHEISLNAASNAGVKTPNYTRGTWYAFFFPILHCFARIALLACGRVCVSWQVSSSWLQCMREHAITSGFAAQTHAVVNM